MWGLSRTVVANMVNGVSKGFTRRLVISGVGYRAALDGKILNLQLGYSHDIKYAIPDDIEVVCDTPDRDRDHAAPIVSGSGRSPPSCAAFRKPEPYKGKGIRYADEVILRKEGKKK